jgi:glycosyltransferase involved in cell wall biosynthesis
MSASAAPVVCVLGAGVTPLIADFQQLAAADPQSALAGSAAEAFLINAENSDAHDAEWCALAVWGGSAVTKLPGGALCVSRGAMASARTFRELAGRVAAPSRDEAAGAGRWGQLHRHLANAQLTSISNWLKHPLRSAGRLIPLRLKERVNRAAGRPLFDLSFYLQFQMQSLPLTETIAPLLRYAAPRAQRRRIALITPHLGLGGAESVLLEAAGAIDRERFEIFLLATQSRDARWKQRWEQAADHVYDLAGLVPPEKMVAAVCSMAANWRFDTVLLHNSLAAYAAIPHLRRELPGLKVIDMIHAVDAAWDFVSATANVAAQIDVRIVESESGRQRLLQAGVPAAKIRLIRNGVDLDSFRPALPRAEATRRTILFAGRLDAVKRPLMLPDIARELVKLRTAADFRVVVAGDGPEREALRAKVREAGLEGCFELMGHVPSMPAALADADVLVLPSRGEGIPLIVLEALAAGRPVVCSRVGAVEEAVDASTGFLIEPGVGEAARFAAALARLLADSDARQAMGQAGRRRVEAEFDLRKARDAYRQVVEEEVRVSW